MKLTKKGTVLYKLYSSLVRAFVTLMTTAECRAKIWPEKIIYAPTPALVAVHSKGVVLLLLIHCLLLLLFVSFLILQSYC